MDQGSAGVRVAPSLALAHMFVKKKKRSKKLDLSPRQAHPCTRSDRPRRSDGADADDERDEGRPGAWTGRSRW